MSPLLTLHLHFIQGEPIHGHVLIGFLYAWNRDQANANEVL